MTQDGVKAEDVIAASESYIDLSKLEKRQHDWVQRGRYLGCHCHPHTGVMLPQGTNLVNVKDGVPVFEKS
jgi:hypothetical protein